MIYSGQRVLDIQLEYNGEAKLRLPLVMNTEKLRQLTLGTPSFPEGFLRVIE